MNLLDAAAEKLHHKNQNSTNSHRSQQPPLSIANPSKEEKKYLGAKISPAFCWRAKSCQNTELMAVIDRERGASVFTQISRNLREKICLNKNGGKWRKKGDIIPLWGFAAATRRSKCLHFAQYSVIKKVKWHRCCTLSCLFKFAEN